MRTKEEEAHRFQFRNIEPYFGECLNTLILCLQVELSNAKAELRILEVFYHKIYKVTCINLRQSY
jgi:hypothetical protein